MKKILILFVILIPVLLFLTLILKADEINKNNLGFQRIMIDNKFEKLAIGKYVSKRVFAHGKPSLIKIKGDTINYPFENILNEFIHLDASQKDISYMLLFKVKNNTNEKKELILELDNPLINELEFFEIINDKIYSYNHSGNEFEFKNKQMKHRNFLFQLQISPGAENIYYLYVFNKGKSTDLPLNLYTKEAFMGKEYEKQFVLGFFYASLIIFVVWSLFFYLGLLQKYFLYLAISIIIYVVWALDFHGYNLQYIWYDIPLIKNHSYVVIGYISVFAMLRFVLMVYVNHANSKYMPTILQSLSYLSLLFVLFAFLEEELYFFASYILQPIYFILHLFCILLMIYSANYSTYLKKNLFALLGISLILIELFLLQQYIFVNENIYTKPFYLFFYIASFMFIIFGLIAKLRIFPNEEAFQRVIAINKLIAVNEYKERQKEN